MAWQIKFRNLEHEKGFHDFIKKAEIQDWDKERTSLFYILALFEETRRHINDLYDFEENCIKCEGVKEAWQTGGTTKATKLAFNLFNDFRGDDREKENYSPLELFSLDTDYRNYMLMAVQIRFS